MKYRVNQQVETVWGVGKIIKRHENFYALEFLTMSPQEWLDRQLIPVKEEQLNEPWYTVEMEDGCSWESESKLTCFDPINN